MIRTITTACPRNCYSTCGLRVTVEDGRLRRIEAHPGNRATAEAPCLKGLSYVERVYSPDRLLHPLRRTRGGGFERVSWDDAVDLIAGRLRGYRDEPQSVLFAAARVGIGLALPLAMLLAAGPAGLPVALAGAVIGELLDRADFYGSLEVTRHGA